MVVQWFRARLNRFLESVKGHALLSVKSDIEKELRDSQHSDSATRKYCTGTPYGERTGLTDYCMCSACHARTVHDRNSNTTTVVTAAMVSTKVEVVLQKYSTQWHIRSQIHSRWLCWRGRCLRTAQQMAVRAVAEGAAAAVAAAESSVAKGAAAKSAATSTATQSASAEGAATEGAAAEGAVAEGAATCTSAPQNAANAENAAAKCTIAEGAASESATAEGAAAELRQTAAGQASPPTQMAAGEHRLQLRWLQIACGLSN